MTARPRLCLALLGALASVVLSSTARASEPEEAAALAALVESYDRSLVTLSWSGAGPGQRSIIAVVVGEGLVMAPANPRAGELGVHLLAADGLRYPVQFVLGDDLLGIDLWRIEEGEAAPDLEPVRFPKAPRLPIGARIVGLSPLPLGYTRSVAWRSSRVNAEKVWPVHSYRTEQPIGDAGTLVCNVQGAPIGVLFRSRQPADPGVSIRAADHFHDLIADATAEGAPRRPEGVPTLGVDLQAVGPRAAASLGLAAEGCARVVRLHDASPASGLQVGDLILSVDGLRLDPVRSDEDLVALQFQLRRRAEGELVAVNVLRPGSEPSDEMTSLELTLPLVASLRQSHRRLPGRRIPSLGMYAREGPAGTVSISHAVRGGSADLAGLHAGDEVLTADAVPVTGIESLVAAMQRLREGGVTHTTIQLRRAGIGSFRRLALDDESDR